MSRRPRTKTRTLASAPPEPLEQAPNRKRLRVVALFWGVLVAALVAVLANAFKGTPGSDTSPLPVAGTPTAQPAAVAATHVGSANCKACHESEFIAWSGSHHQLAMQDASSATVLGDFANARFKQNGVESTFFKRGEQFMVRTDGPDGQLADYEVRYTFGVYPLQQYLIPFAGGRYQVLPLAWDTRPQSAGGQRWFHLYPKQKVDHQDPLHWTGVYHNWALQCAECHSTNLRKGYDAASDSYQTRYSEINVACEACHGPASRHLDWARQSKAPYAIGDDKGLPTLKSRWNEAWKFPADGARVAVRDPPAAVAGMNSCAACHARRSTLREEREPGAALEDSHRLAMLTATNYHPDGQQREEVYVWGSFLQSRMYQNGVTCMDCHEPHAQKLRAEGNALCTRCHAAAGFDTPKHHRHTVGDQGAQCVNCHMPTQNYMVIHARQDHSLRVPRPDLSVTLGSPNACNQCHIDRNPQWAARVMDQWYGKSWRERPEYGSILHAGETQGLRALPGLLDLAARTTAPAIVRATAATLAQPYAHPGTLPAARALLQDPDPSVRIAALGLVAAVDPVNRVLSASPLLSDRVLGVRIEAARVLADIPDSQIPSGRRAARATALQAYESALALEADWPSGQLNLGNLRLRQGRTEEAIAAFERALKRDAQFAGAYVNLADALRQLGREQESERVLRRGLAALPRDADLHHALALLLTRRGDQAAALKEFGEAARLGPDNARYAYVLALAVDSAGQREQAMVLLRSADKRHPGDPEILGALLSMSRESGERQVALRYAQQLAGILPDNANLRRLIAELQAQ